jgi:predicted O-methyltransferase YrrM
VTARPADPSSWFAADEYLVASLALSDPVLGQALADARAAGLPAIDVSPPQGRLLHILARAVGARRILEVGTLGGYSTIWLARALPEHGVLISLELEARHAEVARANLARAGLGDRVEVRVGPAADSLAALVAERTGSFDVVFIDADKPNNALYLERALQLTAPGSLIVVDNVVRGGAITDPTDLDPNVVASRAVLERMGAEPRLVATALQTVGSKGHDGFALGLVVDPA